MAGLGLVAPPWADWAAGLRAAAAAAEEGATESGEGAAAGGLAAQEGLPRLDPSCMAKERPGTTQSLRGQVFGRRLLCL